MKLLLIEDNDSAARDVVQLLAAGSDEGIKARHVRTCEQGLEALREQEYDVVLVDPCLPDSNGADTIASLIKEHWATPFVVLSGTVHIDVALHAVRLGVQDYLIKDHIDDDKLHRAIRFAIERKHIERRLEFLAGHDQLTGLTNRLRLHATAEHVLANAERLGVRAAILFIDLDYFKAVNDRLGHAAGDELLVSVGNRIRAAIRRGDTAARLGGDEFAVLLEGMPNALAAETVAMKILGSLTKTFVIDGQEQQVSASIGIAVYPDDGLDIATLLRNADVAMYAAKANGRNAWKRHERPGCQINVSQQTTGWRCNESGANQSPRTFAYSAGKIQENGLPEYCLEAPLALYNSRSTAGREPFDVLLDCHGRGLCEYRLSAKGADLVD